MTEQVEQVEVKGKSSPENKTTYINYGSVLYLLII